jgi:hypothetical protein
LDTCERLRRAAIKTVLDGDDLDAARSRFMRITPEREPVDAALGLVERELEYTPGDWVVVHARALIAAVLDTDPYARAGRSPTSV